MKIRATLLLGSTILFAVSAAHAHGDPKREVDTPIDSALDSITSPLLNLSLLQLLQQPPPPSPVQESMLEASYTLFESGQVRPLAMSPNKRLLFATNTPDNRLEIFQVTFNGLQHRLSVPVGLEPVAVAARNDNEVWVVNHVSDSVSVVRIDGDARGAWVERTILVGDEPRDVVFANDHAFVTTAHRGQNSPVDPQLTTAGVPRADVFVFDAAAMSDTPQTVLSLFTDTPRALAVSPDGRNVYAAGFHTGNRTATIFELYVPDGGPLLGGIPAPRMNHQGIPAFETGLIVKWNGQHWVDTTGVNHDSQMRFRLPDRDVFTIDATANPPALVPSGVYSGVGTVLFNMAVNPTSGAVYVSNTEANNHNRFEGPGTFAGSSIRGHLAESRVTVISPSNGQVRPRHLNKHINYGSCCGPVGSPENRKSLAFPMDMQVTRDGQTLYVAAQGSSKIGVFPTAAIENDTFVPSEQAQIPVTGGGPTGLALDESRRKLYVLTRFDNSIAVIDTSLRREVSKVPMHSPEPERVKKGRRVLYDAAFTSSHGDSACASCHVFGDLDSLAWDLGNPDADVVLNQNQMVSPALGFTLPLPIIPIFHPMKGPMTTQSLRGMNNHGPMHWRGDRTGADSAPNQQPHSGQFDEDAAFKRFNPAFVDLLGRNAMISDEDMQAFTDFILEMTYPPNPIRNLDNSLTPDQQAGRDIFFNQISTVGNTCQQCHRLDKDANRGFTSAPGFFGSDGRLGFDFEQQLFKVPHLRNLYQKVGRFGQPPHPIIVLQDHEEMGDQIRGFGFTHDGGFDTIFRFESLVALQFPNGNTSRRQTEQFFLAFDSNLAPIVGQQVTLGAANVAAAAAAATNARIDLMRARAESAECELIAKSRKSDLSEVGWLYVGAGMFMTDREGMPSIGDAVLRAMATSTAPITFTCVPPHAGLRMGLDRDLDGHFDGDERAAGTDPGDPTSHP